MKFIVKYLKSVKSVYLTWIENFWYTINILIFIIKTENNFVCMESEKWVLRYSVIPVLWRY